MRVAADMMMWTSSLDNPFSPDLMWTVWTRVVKQGWEGDTMSCRNSDSADCDDTSMSEDS